MKLSIVVSVSSDVETELEELAEKVLIFALNFLGEKDISVSVLLTNDEQMQALNKQYREIDKSTDVLSFSLREGESFPSQDIENLGDIVVSMDYAERQALEYGVSLENELKRLLVHGCLHLLGYEHENVSEQEAEKMFAKENEILSCL